MPIDAGSISSEIRIKLEALNRDIAAATTAFDNLGKEFTDKAANYSNVGGKQYSTALKNIEKETKNVTAAAKAGALTEQDALRRLIDLRQKELQVLQNRAIQEQGGNKATIDAINNTQKSITQLTEKQRLLGGETEKSSKLAGGLGKALQAIGATVSLAAVIGFVKKSATAFAEAQISAQRLDLALKLNNMESAKKGLEALAAKLQNLAGIDGDYVKQLESELVAQGRSEKQITDLITASAGLSSVTGDDLATSLEQLNKMYEGVTPRSSALKAVTDGLTEAQLKNGDGLKIVLDKYEGYIGKVGEASIRNKRLKESINDLLESIGSVATDVAAKPMENLTESFGALASNLSNMGDINKALDARKKGTATVEQELTAIDALLVKIALKKNAPLMGLMNVVALKQDIAGVRAQVTELEKIEPVSDMQRVNLNREIFALKSDILKDEKTLAEITKLDPNNPEIKKLLQERELILENNAERERASKSAAEFTGKREQEEKLSERILEIQKEYAESITQSLRNQKDTGDVEGGLTSRINLTKEYIEKLNAEGASTADAKKKLVDFEYQLNTLNNIKGLNTAKNTLSEIGLTVDQLTEKQRKNRIDEINGTIATQKSKDDLIAVLKEQWAAEDAIKKAAQDEADANKKAGEAAATAEKQAEANKKLALTAEDYRKKLAELNKEIDNSVEAERTKALEAIKGSGASAASIDETTKAINAYFDALKESKSADEAKKKLEELKKTIQSIGTAAKDAFFGIMDAAVANIESQNEKLIKELEDTFAEIERIKDESREAEAKADEEEYQRRRELIENDGKTKMEALQAELFAAQEAGDTEAAREAQKQIDLLNLEAAYLAEKERKEKAFDDAKIAREKEFARAKAKLEYDSALASWKVDLSKAIVAGALSIANIWATNNPVAAAILSIASGAAVGAEIAIINSAKPQMPKLATGGIVLPRSGGVPAILAENNYAELALNGGPSGAPFLQEFADKIAASVSGSGGSRGTVHITIQSVLDGKVVAQNTVEYINNGQVRMA